MTHPWQEQLKALGKPSVGWIGLGAALGLTAAGITAIATVSPGDAASQGQRWLPVALLAMLVCMLPRPRMIGLASYVLAAGALGLMSVVIVPGIPHELAPVINGARRWINLQFMLLQPAELAKIAFVLALAWYLRYRSSYRTFLGLLVPFVIVFLPIGVLLQQPDLGTAMLFVPTLFIMLIAAGAKLRHLGALAGLGTVVVGLNVAVIAFDAPQSLRPLKAHQEARIAAMLWPERYADDKAYQQDVATRLVGAGGLHGQGAEQARLLLRYNHLPEDHNDMVFAVVMNRWGLLGGLGLMAGYLVLLGSFVAAAARSKDPFMRLACVGLGGMIFTQAAINIGVTVGLLPITGLTLPFVSYGGSSLVATFAMIGLLLNFSSRRPAYLARPSFEFDEHDRQVDPAVEASRAA